MHRREESRVFQKALLSPLGIVARGRGDDSRWSAAGLGGGRAWETGFGGEEGEMRICSLPASCSGLNVNKSFA